MGEQLPDKIELRLYPILASWPIMTFAFPVLFFIAFICAVHLPILKLLPEAGWSDYGDGMMFQWNFWWMKYSLFKIGQSPYTTDYLFSPVGVNLFFHDLTPFYGLLSIPLQFWFSLGVIYSLFIELIFFISALGMYLLCLEISMDRRSALVGAICYIFVPYMINFPGQISVLSIQWLPLALWFWIKVEKTHLKRYSVCCALIIVASFYCSFNHTIFILCSMVFFSAAGLLITRKFTYLVLLLKHYFIIIVILSFCIGPLMYSILLETNKYGFYGERSLIEAELNSVDIGQIFQPTPDQMFYSEVKTSRTNIAYLGYMALFLSFLALMSRSVRRNAFIWFLFGLIMFIFSLGPSLLFKGHYPFGSMKIDGGFRLPFYYLTKLPFLSALRVPFRLIIYVNCSLAVLVSLATRTILFRIVRWKTTFARSLAVGFPWLICLVILLEYFPFSEPISYMGHNPILNTLAEKDNQNGLLYIPISHIMEKNKMEHYYCRQIMYLQTIHHRPYTSGYVSRRPADDVLLLPKPYFFSIIRSIQNEEYIPAIYVKRLKRELPFVLSLLHVDTIVLDRSRLSEIAGDNMVQLLQTILPVRETYHSEDLTIWKLPEHVRNSHSTTIDFQKKQGLDAIIPSNQIIEIDEKTPLIIADNVLTVSLPAVWHGLLEVNISVIDLVESVPIKVLLEYEPAGEGFLRPDSKTINVILPKKNNVVPHRLTFEFGAGTLEHSNNIMRPYLFKLPDIICYSAGMGSGNRVWIRLLHRNISTHSRGYCLVAWNEEYPDGDVQRFDTHSSPEESARMVSWIKTLSIGTTVVGAVCDEVSANLTKDGYHALRTLGCSIDMRGKYRWSHAFIGKKGMSPGSAIESHNIGASCVNSNGINILVSSISLNNKRKLMFQKDRQQYEQEKD